MTRTVITGVDTDPSALRAAYGAFPSGVMAVCGVDEHGARVGMAVSTFIPVSLDPPLVGLALQATSRTWPVLRALPALGLSVLSTDHHHAARQLAAFEGDRFVGVSTTTAQSGAVFVDAAPAHFECSFEEEFAAGDHVIATLRIVGIAVEEAMLPLVFHRSGFGGVAPLANVDLSIR